MKPALQVSDWDVKAIKKLYMSGVTQAEIAKVYGVTQSYISRICNGLKRRVLDVDELERKWNEAVKASTEFSLPK